MSEEIVKDNTEENGGAGFTLGEILYVLRRNIVLIILIVVLAAGAGVLYSFLRQPRYTATERANMTAKDVTHDGTLNDSRAMNAYFDTVMDFCDEGVTLLRANAIYIDFLNVKKGEGEDYRMQDYLDRINGGVSSIADDEEESETYIVAADVAVTPRYDSNNNVSFLFDVKYTDDDAYAAVDKAKAIVQALKEKCVEKEADGVTEKYFLGVEININDAGLDEVASSTSKVKTVLVFAAVGAVAALVVVYLKNLLDNTIKNKDELERITDAQVIGIIYEQEEGKND